MRVGDARSLIGVALLAVFSAVFYLSALTAFNVGDEANGILIEIAGVDTDTPAADAMHGGHCAAHSNCAALVSPEGIPPPPDNTPVISFSFQTGYASAASPPLLQPPKPL